MPGPKRFYRAAESAVREGGFAILLDGKPVKTPSMAPFLVPTGKLAEAIAAEWAAQDKTIVAAVGFGLPRACHVVERAGTYG